MGSDLTVSVIDSSESLGSMRGEWNRLLDESRSPSICLRWEWIHAWWEIYRDCGVALHVLCARDGDRLVGIAPFFLQHKMKFGFLRVRVLRFLGTGEPEWEEVASEYLDIIARSGHEENVTRAVWAYLRRLGSWDQLIFNDVLPDSLIMTILRRLMIQGRLCVREHEVGIRYSVKLPQTWDAYLVTLDSGAAKRLPYKRRKFERAGQVAERVVTAPQELDAAFEELIRLHTARWAARGRPGVFVSQRFTTYHKALAQMLLPLGMLNIRLLSLDGVNIAVLYNFRYGGKDYFYQGGFDVEHAAKYSPGILAHIYAIESAIHGRLGEYDFMKGGLTSYKSEFGCQECPMHDMRIFSRTARGRILWLEARARCALRPLKRKLQSLAGFAARSSQEKV